MSNINSAVIRLRCDSQRFESAESDFLTGRTPGFWASNDLRIEVGRFNLGKDPAALLSVANLSSLKVEVKPSSDRDAAALMEGTTEDFDDSITLEDWNGGDGQHAVVEFTHFETALPIADGSDVAEFWLVISAITTAGKWITLYGGTLRVFRDGTPTTELAPLQGGNVVPVGATYDGGGAYTLNVTSDKLYSWTAQANDDAYNNGGGDITTDGNFTAAAATVTLKGTAGQPVTAIVRSKVYLDAEESDARFLTPRIRWIQGGWSIAVEYIEGDGLTYGGSSWRAKRDNVGVTPVVGDDWELIASAAINGIPAGGSTAQVLAKVNGTDYNAAWVTLPVNSGNLTVDRALISDGSGKVAVSTVTATELAYVSGVTSAIQTQINLKAPLASPVFSGVPTVPTAAPGTNTLQAASTAFVTAAISTAVSGVLDLQGNIDASTNPNYPAASTGHLYYVTVAGKVGGASGKDVEVGDSVICKADNAGGDEAAVGTSWFVLEKNLNGALVASNNLSELTATASTARSNIGAAAAADLANYLPLAGGTMAGAITLPNGARITGVERDGSKLLKSESTNGYDGILLTNGNSSVYGIASHYNAAGFEFGSGVRLGWASTGFGNAVDTALLIDSAGVLAQRVGTTAQEFRVYGTYGGGGSDYLRASLSATSTTVTLSAQTGGAEADNVPIYITPAGTGALYLGAGAGAAKATVDQYGQVTSSGGATLGNNASAAFGTNQLQWGNGEGLGYYGCMWRSSGLVTWSQYGNQAASGHQDLGLGRGAAGRLDVTDGVTTTAYRDVKLRTLYFASGIVITDISGNLIGTYQSFYANGFKNDGAYQFESDLFLYRDAAAILAVRNGTNAQSLRVYGTYGGGGADYVRASLSSTNTTVTLAAQTGGAEADDIDLVLTPAGAGGVLVTGLTASRAVVSDASSHLVASTVTATELGYVSGVTSAIQTQINTLSTGSVKALAVGTADATVTNTTTETTLVPTITGSATLAANYFVVGKAFRLTAKGHLTTAAVPGTLRIRIRLGGISGTVVLDTGAQTPTASLADKLWEVSAVITCRTTGGSGTVIGQSDFYHEVVAVGAPYSWGMVNTSAITIDTTASQAVVISAEWGTADAGNDITLTDFLLEQITNAA